MDRNRHCTDTDYTWALAEQRMRADEDRAAVVRDLIAGMQRRWQGALQAFGIG